MLSLRHALRETLPALETTITLIAGICVFVSMLCIGVVAAWSIGLYLWLVQFMEPTEAAFVVGFVLLGVALIAVVIGRVVVRDRLSGDGTTTAQKNGTHQKYEAVASALEAVSGMAKGRPFSALLTALALGVASGYFTDTDNN